MKEARLELRTPWGKWGYTASPLVWALLVFIFATVPGIWIALAVWMWFDGDLNQKHEDGGSDV